MTRDGKLAQIVRTWLLPRLLPLLASVRSFRDWRFRSMSQIKLNYRGRSLSEGRAGKVHGGDRLPWARGEGHDNFASLSRIGWQAHVYGDSNPTLAAWCEQKGLPLHVFSFTPAHAKAGLKRHALYLLRPDTYVALASEEQSTQVLQGYFEERAITP
jgi:hypothetical protein